MPPNAVCPPHPFILRQAQDERMLPICQPQPLPGFRIPACAGMTVGGRRWPGGVGERRRRISLRFGELAAEFAGFVAGSAHYCGWA